MTNTWLSPRYDLSDDPEWEPSIDLYLDGQVALEDLTPEDQLAVERMVKDAKISKMREEHFAKHLPGGHDQKTHGMRGAGGHSSDIGTKIARIATENPEGFTFHGGRLLEGGKDGGYVVAVKGSPSLALDHPDPAKISSWVAANAKGRSVGGWKDDEANKYVMDIVEVVADRGKAIQLGKERNEKEIWDVYNSVGIKVGGEGNY